MKKKLTPILFVVVLILGIAVFPNRTPADTPISANTAAAPADNTASTTSDSEAGEPVQLHFLNVGQGDAELITSGDHAVLIDGGKQSAGDMVVDYLTRQGITTLDAVIATHPHEDHIGGLVDVLDAMDVKAFYMSDEATDTKIYGKLLDAIENEGITPEFPDINDTIPFTDTAKFTVLAPGPDAAETYSNDMNTWSLVVRLDANGCRALFTGDTTKAVEQDMVQRDAEALNCDVLKVAHHGSRTSSCDEFIQAASPDYAVISYAEGNSYGLPDEEIFDALKPFNTTIFETAKNGTVVLTLDNGEVTAA